MKILVIGDKNQPCPPDTTLDSGAWEKQVVPVQMSSALSLHKTKHPRGWSLPNHVIITLKKTLHVGTLRPVRFVSIWVFSFGSGARTQASHVASTGLPVSLSPSEVTELLEGVLRSPNWHVKLRPPNLLNLPIPTLSPKPAFQIRSVPASTIQF